MTQNHVPPQVIRQCVPLPREPAPTTARAYDGTIFRALARCLYHELATPLTVVSTHLDLLARQLARCPEGSPATDPRLREGLGAAREAAERLGVVLRGLRRRVGGRWLDGTPARLDQLVAGALDALPLAPDALIERALDATPPTLLDAESVQLVTAALVLNAVDAAQDGPRRVRVSVRAQEGYALLAVDDDGAGIPPDLTERVFAPFYSTKPGAVGLGLSLARTLVEAHGGALRHEPIAPKGTRCVASFPLTPLRLVDLVLDDARSLERPSGSWRADSRAREGREALQRTQRVLAQTYGQLQRTRALTGRPR